MPGSVLEHHSEQVRSNRGSTVFTNKLIIVNPSKLATKTQDQMSEIIKLYWPPKSILGGRWGRLDLPGAT